MPSNTDNELSKAQIAGFRCHPHSATMKENSHDVFAATVSLKGFTQN